MVPVWSIRMYTHKHIHYTCIFLGSSIYIVIHPVVSYTGYEVLQSNTTPQNLSSLLHVLIQ